MNQLFVNDKKVKRAKILAYCLLPISIGIVILFFAALMVGLLTTANDISSIVLSLILLLMIIGAGFFILAYAITTIILVQGVSFYQKYAKPNQPVEINYYARLMNKKPKIVSAQLKIIMRRNYLSGHITEDGGYVILHTSNENQQL